MKTHKKVILGFIITILLLIGAFIAYYLSQRPQDIRQRASEKPFGKAIQFDGTTTTLTASFSATNTISEPFTIEGWFKPDFTNKSSTLDLINIDNSSNSSGSACTQNLRIVADSFSNTANQPDDRYSIYVAHEDAQTNGTLSPQASYSIPLNNWVHFALSVTSSNSASIFYNGVKVGEEQLTAPLCIASNMTIGAGGEMDPQNFFKGDMDEIRISNTARYADSFTPPTTPFVVDSNTLDLWRFDGSTKDELTNETLIEAGTVTYIDSPLPETAPPPACQANISTCAWDAVDTAVSYHFKITRSASSESSTTTSEATIIKEGDIQSPGTSVTFVSEDNATYSCEVAATNVCGTGDKASTTATCVVPTSTPTPIPTTTPTPSPTLTPTVTPTVTPTPTPTAVPTPTPTSPPAPTATPVPPQPSVAIPTATPIPPAPQTCGYSPCSETQQCSNGLVCIAANNGQHYCSKPEYQSACAMTPGYSACCTAPVQPNTPTPTLPSPGSAIETITIAGGIILTIVGALILFVL
jgi:hypothetical protein